MDPIDALLSKAERVEALSASIYRALAQKLPEGSAARRVFVRLAGEEDEHAARIRLLKQRIAARPWNPEMSLDQDAADELVAHAEELLRRVEEGGPQMSMEEAAGLLLENEHKLSQAHAHSLIAGDRELESFFSELASQDRVHLQALRRLEHLA